MSHLTNKHWMRQCSCIWHMSSARFCPLRELNLRDANDRLKTFHLLEWPADSHMKPVELAEAGFFYSGEDDHVYCFHCNLGLHAWTKTDIPALEHIKYNRNCLFTRGYSKTGNVPIIGSPFANRSVDDIFDIVDRVDDHFDF